MRSMTGFGRGFVDVGERRLVVEMRSVNHRFLDLKMRLPWADPLVEQKVGQAVRRRLERGSVSVSIREEAGSDGATLVRADLDLARAYLDAVRRVAIGLGLGNQEVPLKLVVSQPGVLSVAAELPASEELWTQIAPAVEQCLDSLSEARAREGDALKADLDGRVAALRRIVGEVARLSAEGPQEIRRRLEDRLKRLLSPGEVDPQRLAMEVALLADRADITEEITRFGVHLDEATRLLAEPQPSGRRLDFLTQELHREINTIGSKSQRVEVAARVVEAKAEVERFREQIQNVE